MNRKWHLFIEMFAKYFLLIYYHISVNDTKYLTILWSSLIQCIFRVQFNNKKRTQTIRNVWNKETKMQYKILSKRKLVNKLSNFPFECMCFVLIAFYLLLIFRESLAYNYCQFAPKSICIFMINESRFFSTPIIQMHPCSHNVCI